MTPAAENLFSALKKITEDDFESLDEHEFMRLYQEINLNLEIMVWAAKDAGLPDPQDLFEDHIPNPEVFLRYIQKLKARADNFERQLQEAYTAGDLVSPDDEVMP